MNRRSWIASLGSFLGVAPAIQPTKVEVVLIQPTDVVLLTVPDTAPIRLAREAAQQFKDATGCRKVIVHRDSMQVRVLRNA